MDDYLLFMYIQGYLTCNVMINFSILRGRLNETIVLLRNNRKIEWKSNGLCNCQLFKGI